MKFLKDTPLTDRMSSKAKKELQELKKNDIDEYNKRHQITSSQARLLEEDLRRTSTQNKGQLKAFYNSLEVTYPNDDDTIQVGSIVDLYLQDGDNEPTKHHFEFINRAVSTEVDADYVERISTLGTAIYGLKAGDTFSVRRKNMPSLKGVIDSVDNKRDVVRRVR